MAPPPPGPVPDTATGAVVESTDGATIANPQQQQQHLTPSCSNQSDRKRAVLKPAKKRRRVLDPSGALYHHWSMVVGLAFLYNFWSLSYRFAFREIDHESVAFWFALDYSADLIYLLDVVVNFHTGYLSEGVLERNLDKIGLHYRESTLFYLDCFCFLPLDFLYLSIGFNSILRCTRLVKIYKFWSYVDRAERHTNYPNVFRTLALVHYILVILHWNACIFHMISKRRLLDLEGLFRIADNRCADTQCQYLHAFYWSTLALATLGGLPRPRTKGEYVFVTLQLFFGLFLFASVLGHVANIVTNVSAARKEFQAKLDNVKRFMRMRHVSEELQNKVVRWFDYLWLSQNSSDEERSVACLPDRLKAEIAIQVHLDTLKRVDIFQNTEAGFLCELVLRLKPVLFSPGDFVCRKNEVGHEMYIVSRGILEVVADEGGQVVATLQAGSYFGEISVLNVGQAGNKRTASVRSVGYSDLFCLKRQDLWEVLQNYPQAEERIRLRAEQRLVKLDVHQQAGGASWRPAPPTRGPLISSSWRRLRHHHHNRCSSTRDHHQQQQQHRSASDQSSGAERGRLGAFAASSSARAPPPPPPTTHQCTRAQPRPRPKRAHHQQSTMCWSSSLGAGCCGGQQPATARHMGGSHECTCSCTCQLLVGRGPAGTTQASSLPATCCCWLEGDNRCRSRMDHQERPQQQQTLANCHSLRPAEISTRRPQLTTSSMCHPSKEEIDDDTPSKAGQPVAGDAGRQTGVSPSATILADRHQSVEIQMDESVSLISSS